MRQRGGGRFGAGGLNGDVQRALGRAFDRQADFYWHQIRALGSGSSTPLELALNRMDINVDRLVFSDSDEINDVLIAAEDSVPEQIERFRRSFRLPSVEWDVFGASDVRSATLDDVDLARRSGTAVLLGSWPGGHDEPPSLLSAFL